MRHHHLVHLCTQGALNHFQSFLGVRSSLPGGASCRLLLLDLRCKVLHILAAAGQHILRVYLCLGQLELRRLQLSHQLRLLVGGLLHHGVHVRLGCAELLA